MIALDTNILVYAVGSPHAFAEPCQAMVAAIRDHRLEATTTPAVIQEFVHVTMRRRPLEAAIALAVDFADLLAPLVSVGEVHLRRGLRILKDHPDLEAFDALLAAVVIEESIDAVVSADARLGAVNDLQVIVPGTDRFAELLG